MPVKSYRPTTPTRRFQTVVSREDITKQRPEKSLVRGKKRTGGRSSTGRISSRFIGGGHKQAYREIDFKRDKVGIQAKVAAIEYDPNRSARIALLHYTDGEKRYILAPVGLTVGRMVSSGPEADILIGNALPLKIFRRARWYTISSCGRVRAGRWLGRPARRRNWFRGKATLRC